MIPTATSERELPPFGSCRQILMADYDVIFLIQQLMSYSCVDCSEYCVVKRLSQSFTATVSRSQKVEVEQVGAGIVRSGADYCGLLNSSLVATAPSEWRTGRDWLW